MSIYGEYKNATISEILESSGGRGSRRTISVTTGLDGRRSLLLEISKDEPDFLQGFIIGRRRPQNQEDDEENEVLGKEDPGEGTSGEEASGEEFGEEASGEEDFGEEDFGEEDFDEEDPDEEDFGEEDPDEEAPRNQALLGEEEFGVEALREEDFGEEDLLGEEQADRERRPW